MGISQLIKSIGKNLLPKEIKANMLILSRLSLVTPTKVSLMKVPIPTFIADWLRLMMVIVREIMLASTPGGHVFAIIIKLGIIMSMLSITYANEPTTMYRNASIPRLEVILNIIKQVNMACKT